MKTFRIIRAAFVAIIIGMNFIACDDNEKVEEQNYEIDYSDTTNWVKISAVEHEADRCGHG